MLAWSCDGMCLFGMSFRSKQPSTQCSKTGSVAMSFQQPLAHADAPCLRFPENIGLHANVTIEAAANMLARAAQLSLTVPYSWAFIDKPVGTSTRDRTRKMCADVLGLISEGQVVLIFLPNPAQFPNDGIRYQDQETRYALPAPGNRVHVLPTHPYRLV